MSEQAGPDLRCKRASRLRFSFPLTLPYYRANEELPSPLPSIAEIRVSQQTLSTRQQNRCIVRVGNHYVVKYGDDLNLIEGENLLFVKQNCDVPVPEIYAIFRDEATKCNYIIMQFIPGKSLASLWESLDNKSKNSIAQELRQTFDRLRQLPTQDYYGKLGNRPYFDEIFTSLESATHKEICGPFTTHDDMINAIVYRYTHESQYPQRGEYFQRALPLVLRSEGPVFTHGDLQRKNVIVRDDGIPFIIDWEAAAFYPKYYEYYTAMAAFGHYRDDWHTWVGRILAEYVAELGWLDTIRRELL